MNMIRNTYLESSQCEQILFTVFVVLAGEESLNLTDMSHESSVVDADEMQLQAMESDESL